jgi:hypothetical protein
MTGIAPQQAMYDSVRYRDAETTVPVLVAPLPPNCIAQPLQNCHVEMTSNTLPRLYEVMVNQTVNVKEFRELSDCPSCL